MATVPVLVRVDEEKGQAVRVGVVAPGFMRVELDGDTLVFHYPDRVLRVEVVNPGTALERLVAALRNGEPEVSLEVP